MSDRFVPGGEPITVWCTDTVTPVEDTPVNVTARSIANLVTTAIGQLAPDAVVGGADGLSDSGTRDLPRASFVRVGELHFQPVLELKKRVCNSPPHPPSLPPTYPRSSSFWLWLRYLPPSPVALSASPREPQSADLWGMPPQVHEVTAWPIDKMVLFFGAKPAAGGRAIRELVGWQPDWPWDPDMTVIRLTDDLPLESFGVLRKSKGRAAAEMFALEAHRLRLRSDPEYRREVQHKRLLVEEAKMAAKKSSGKGKKGKKGKGKGKGDKGGDGKKMGEKEMAVHHAKELAKANKQKTELIAQQDKTRSWPENQVYLILKAAGVPERAGGSSFIPRVGLHVDKRRPSSFLQAMPLQKAFHNSVAAQMAEDNKPPRAMPLHTFLGEATEKFSDLPPIRGWPAPLPPRVEGDVAPADPNEKSGTTKKKSSSKKKKKSSSKKKK